MGGGGSGGERSVDNVGLVCCCRNTPRSMIIACCLLYQQTAMAEKCTGFLVYFICTSRHCHYCHVVCCINKLQWHFFSFFFSTCSGVLFCFIRTSRHRDVLVCFHIHRIPRRMIIVMLFVISTNHNSKIVFPICSEF